MSLRLALGLSPKEAKRFLNKPAVYLYARNALLAYVKANGIRYNAEYAFASSADKRISKDILSVLNLDNELLDHLVDLREDNARVDDLIGKK